LATIYDSTFIGPGTFKTPNTSWSLKSLNSNYPILDFLLSGMVLKSFLQMLIIAGIYYIYRQFAAKSTFRKFFVMLIIALPFVLPLKPEITHLISNTIWIGSIFLLIRYFWRGNPWSYLFGVIGFFTLPDIIIYFNTIQDPTYRAHGFIAIISVIIFLLYFAKEAFLIQTKTTSK
jgi:hypothetical protein